MLLLKLTACISDIVDKSPQECLVNLGWLDDGARLDMRGVPLNIEYGEKRVLRNPLIDNDVSTSGQSCNGMRAVRGLQFRVFRCDATTGGSVNLLSRVKVGEHESSCQETQNDK